MQKFLCSAVLAGLLAGSASLVAAGDLKLTLANGRATLIAQDVPLRQILDEWARVGKTTIVNGDKLTGPPLTLQLIDRPEREVLDLLLRSASGYIVAQREPGMPGASQFDRVMILPVSRGPVGVAAAPPPAQFRPPVNTMPQMPTPMPVADDDDPPEPPQMAPGPASQPPLPNIPAQFPGTGQAPALTAPRPGILPAPPPGQPNPYGTPVGPGVVPPPFVRPPGGPGGA